jgi:Rps23 Pro-64 3,4-dihydroxylase Tpa1-like proline 4-hydroxylase
MGLNFKLSTPRLNEHPFAHFVAFGVFPNRVSVAVLRQLEQYTAWKRVSTDFYDQYESKLGEGGNADPLSSVCSQQFLGSVKLQLASIFGVSFREQVDVTIHKLIAGQYIELHNDYIPGDETHRLIVQLNRGWTQENGGETLLYSSSSPCDVFDRLPPIHNSAVGFEISPRSYHGVRPIERGERYSLIFSLSKME